MSNQITFMDPRRVFRDDIFSDFFGPFPTMTSAGHNLDMYETEDHVVVELQAPGFQPEHVDISVEDNQLSVTGKIETESVEDDKDKKYYRKEIHKESFNRTVSLPSRVVADDAEATFINGILKVSLPKAPETKQKKVEIKAS